MNYNVNYLFKAAINVIRKNREGIINILTEISTYKSASSEVRSSISTLKKARIELLSSKPINIDSLAVFHPSNVILYSFILYVIIPRAYTKKIYMKPASVVKSQTLRIVEYFKDEFGEDFVELCTVGQRKFTKIAKGCEFSVFTGKYENFVEVKSKAPETVHFFFGSGFNPVVVEDIVCIEKVTTDIITARTFNSGQDCIGPDIIFVNERYKDEFRDNLVAKIRDLKIGRRDEKDTDICDYYYDSAKSFNNAYFIENYSRVSVDLRNNSLVGPVLLESDNLNEEGDIEFFGPVFNVKYYKKIEDVESILFSDRYLKRAMGLSIYGSLPSVARLSERYTIAFDQSYIDIEDGNKPFGGYGIEASSIHYGSVCIAKPILISEDILNGLRLKRSVKEEIEIIK
ncbi:aldehyde dehydrogenase family protein [Photorhabdus tasmaniensis]|uniref:Aldehyde dehydrogenase domain-containing protein n=1 Tax=Photorhabdus tasmaniensis TaxID=1004159 RepID=A0ABX0GM33_9GAMM|nr:aldehyde dehydrogenase family protein [Photorhabdus tasmaniensis]NHB89317.1 hypothetical protein [Photorhabdus tasmaniensis]